MGAIESVVHPHEIGEITKIVERVELQLNGITDVGMRCNEGSTVEGDFMGTDDGFFGGQTRQLKTTFFPQGDVAQIARKYIIAKLEVLDFDVDVPHFHVGKIDGVAGNLDFWRFAVIVYVKNRFRKINFGHIDFPAACINSATVHWYLFFNFGQRILITRAIIQFINEHFGTFESNVFGLNGFCRQVHFIDGDPTPVDFNFHPLPPMEVIF